MWTIGSKSSLALEQWRPIEMLSPQKIKIDILNLDLEMAMDNSYKKCNINVMCFIYVINCKLIENGHSSNANMFPNLKIYVSQPSS